MKRWLLGWERYGLAPSTAGWVLAGVGLFCFLAGTNTLSGWLFAMSGLSWALLAIAAVWARRSIRALAINPFPVVPSSTGCGVEIAAEVANRSDRACHVFSLWPDIPGAMELSERPAIALLAARQSHVLTLSATARERGIYRWSGWWIRTGAPLGLWWYRRWIRAAGEAIVYPRATFLATCPILMAAAGRAEAVQTRYRSSYRNAAHGETRSLRPYRRGDALRLVHWRSSARYGELRSRELEATSGRRPLAIAIDCSRGWQAEDFEQAAIAATSIYLWGKRQELDISVWTTTGEAKGDRQVLAALAAMQPEAESTSIPEQPALWLTWNPRSLERAMADTMWLGWGRGFPTNGRGIRIDPQRDLKQQLQALPGSR